MRTLLLTAALVGFVAPAAAQEKLKVGDKAPPVKATKWLQGKEVSAFAEGKAYVMEFWATWCGPCIVMMPHMGELQKQYAKDVVFIGFSAKDPNNSLEKVQALVEKRGPKLGYTFAYADDRETYDAWMKAAQRNGIPCCFVVDTAGKIAYIGHPMYLDVVLPKVVAGKWTAADNDGIDAIEKDVNGVFQATRDPDPEVFLTKLAEFEKKNPLLAGIPYFNGPRVSSLLKAKKTDEAKKAIEGLIAKGTKTEDHTLLLMASNVARSPLANGDKALLALSMKAAEGALKIAGDKEWQVTLALAEAHFANGDKAKAREFGAKTVALTEKESAGLKQFVENQVKKFEDKKD
ncbi:MAG: TlpA family protein disulfide reductase [Planctomycetes bacterium]|nr:TlpA family protein disulfide reductase [Planctomycetota bacterium]